MGQTTSTAAADSDGKVSVAEIVRRLFSRKSKSEDVRDYAPLLDLLVDDGVLIEPIVQLGENIDEKTIKAIVRVFSAHRQPFTIIRAGLRMEIQPLKSSSLFLRGNSFASKLCKHFLRHATGYLQDLLFPLVENIIAASAGDAFEVDPSRARPDAILKNNQELLLKHCNACMDVILESSSTLPLEVVVVTAMIHEEARTKFPDEALGLVRGFLFLRFFLPPLVSPESIGFRKVESMSERRALVLVSKVLQSLANGVLYGAKEQYMTCMNEFIERRSGDIADFIKRVLTPSTNPLGSMARMKMDPLPTPEEVTDDLILLEKFVTKNLTDVRRILDVRGESVRGNVGALRTQTVCTMDLMTFDRNWQRLQQQPQPAHLHPHTQR